MKAQRRTILEKLWISVCCGGLMAGAIPLCAGTVAWWRFEEGPAAANVNHGGQADGAFYAGVVDSSGHGNALSVWAEDWAGFVYRSDAPFSTVPRTGNSNQFSVQNAGSHPAMFTSDASAMRTMTPLAWTVEVAFKPQADGFRTLVGRDSRGSASSNADLAALYLQIQSDNSLAIKYCDVAGRWHEAISAPGTIAGFTPPDSAAGTWYQTAAVCDGTTLSLYLRTNGNYTRVAFTDMSADTSPNKALSAGTGSGGDWRAGNWSVGRGLYGGNHTDRAFGFLDEVRISDSALAIGDFLGSEVGNSNTLTLTPVSGSNTLNIKISAQGSVAGPLGNINVNTSDTQTATLVGTQALDLGADFLAGPETASATSLNFHDGDIHFANDLTWTLKLGKAYGFIDLGKVTIASHSLDAQLVTPNPPGAVTGGTSFPLSSHDLTLNGGTLAITPSGYVADQGLMSPSTLDLAASPLEAPLAETGNGTVSISPPAVTGTRLSYGVDVTLPINFSKILSTDPVTQTLNLTAPTANPEPSAATCSPSQNVPKRSPMEMSPTPSKNPTTSASTIRGPKSPATR